MWVAGTGADIGPLPMQGAGAPLLKSLFFFFYKKKKSIFLFFYKKFSPANFFIKKKHSWG
jgi:hypothetical protein